MGFFSKAVLYTALCLYANAAAADPATLASLREGDMKKLILHDAPRATPEAEFGHVDGSTHTLAEFRGRWVLLNFWATWCAPCRAEMPMLSALQTDLGGEDFAVVTLATGRNPPPAIARFFDEIGVDNLPAYIDPRQVLARPMGVMGLPVTVILNPEGQEVGRLIGEADWAGESARAILGALIEGG